MPATTVRFFKSASGDIPVLAWLRQLRRRNAKAFAKCMVRIERLEEAGFELRRPEADFVRDGLFELRAREGRVQYRILYFFHGRQVAILAHSLTKEEALPEADIARALERKRLFEKNPEKHTYIEEEPDERA